MRGTTASPDQFLSFQFVFTTKIHPKMKNLSSNRSRILASALILSLFSLTAINVHAQSPASKPATAEELPVPEVMPAPLNMVDIIKTVGYPAEAKTNKIEGKVFVKVLVDTDGNVIDHQLVKDPHKLLSDAVLAHVDELKFTPAQDKGKPTKAWVMIPFQFKLK